MRISYLLLAMMVAGCGPRCDPYWDRIDYKGHAQQRPSEGSAEKESDFGACSQDDLTNYTVDGHSGHSHSGHR